MQSLLRPFPLAVIGLAAWTSAAYLLCSRCHFVLGYAVFSDPAPPDWGLLLLVGVGLALAAGAWRGAVDGRRGGAAWLVACGAVPLLEGLRQRGLPLPQTFAEPLLFAFASGMSAWTVAQGRRAASQLVLPRRGQSSAPAGRWALWRTSRFLGLVQQRLHRRREPPAGDSAPYCLLVVVAAAIGLGLWWYCQASTAYSDYLLGFADFGDYGRRVVNTWEGRGLLMRTPHWPAFFDHFHPGLALLAPLWGLWPDPRLFLAVQAVCLALPAVFVYGIARRLGADGPGAAAWAGAYLAFPATGQLNLNFSYGFHTVSMALPAVMAAIWAVFAGRPKTALLLAILSCSFKQNVFVALAGVAFAMAVLDWINRRRRAQSKGPADEAPVQWPASGISPRRWLLVAAGFGLGFLGVAAINGLLGNAGTWRFQNLGTSAGEIILSPIIRPGAFWGQVLRIDSAYYLLSLLVPVGLPLLWRGWPILIALAAPLGVLLAWESDRSTCIAFQYVTMLIPVIFLAAMVGAVRGLPPGRSRADAMVAAGLMGLVTSAVASLFIGALPMSRQTIPFVLSPADRAELATHHAALDQAVETAGGKQAATLASGRLASHLLGVRRLEVVCFAEEKTAELAREAGPGKRWIELFDWVAVDLQDRWLHHSLDELKTVVLEAESAGYRALVARDGVLVYQRPAQGSGQDVDSLGRWRVGEVDARALADREDARMVAPEIRSARLRLRPVESAGQGQSVQVEAVFQATQTNPPEYFFKYVVGLDGVGDVAESPPHPPADGNRPTSWWVEGEAWIDRSRLSVPSGVERSRLTCRVEAIPFERVVEQGRR